MSSFTKLFILVIVVSTLYMLLNMKIFKIPHKLGNINYITRWILPISKGKFGNVV